DIGQVWGWGYGGEGQLGLGSRIRMVSSPHLIPCIDSSSYGKDISASLSQGSMSSEGQNFRIPGSCIKAIACGGRHSAVITDAGAVLAFGWGLYGQCGQGSTDDELSPTCVSSLLGIRIVGVAAGLWHTVCTSADGDVYAFGGNQFGQLGTGSDQAEVGSTKTTGLSELGKCERKEHILWGSSHCSSNRYAITIRPAYAILATAQAKLSFYD
ncbi:putative E3 ubiquitin-protein ligase HERC1-like protein, partial [Trifolium pratense]